MDTKTSIRAGYGISYTFFNRPGSAIEGINGPLAIFGTFNQTALPGAPGFLTTQNGFNAGISWAPSIRSTAITITSRPIPAGPTFSLGCYRSNAN